MTRVHVVGPSYLDLAIHINGSLVEGQRFDRTARATTWELSDSDLILCFNEEEVLVVSAHKKWADFPRLKCRIGQSLTSESKSRPQRRSLVADGFEVALGGMGAGFAVALSAAYATGLWSWHGDDSNGMRIEALIPANDLSTHWNIVPERQTDRTILMTSSVGDKLGVGLRDSVYDLTVGPSFVDFVQGADILVFAATPNRILGTALSAISRKFVAVAPSRANLEDKEQPLFQWADRIDLLTLNQDEWKDLDGKERFISDTRAVAITKGPEGADLLVGGHWYSSPSLQPRKPIVDTNHAGEAFSVALLVALLDKLPIPLALHQALAAADLEVSLQGFIFPSPVSWREHAERFPQCCVVD